MEGFTYQPQKVKLKPGDLLYLYTDGVNEAMNETGELFGDDRMFAAINNTKGESVRSVIEQINQAVGSFVKETPASDDLTMLDLTIQDRKNIA
jgi:sigma-B regulation protein RsbU (phosphoserine phosphatase)